MCSYVINMADHYRMCGRDPIEQRDLILAMPMSTLCTQKTASIERCAEKMLRYHESKSFCTAVLYECTLFGTILLRDLTGYHICPR